MMNTYLITHKGKKYVTSADTIVEAEENFFSVYKPPAIDEIHIRRLEDDEKIGDAIEFQAP